MSPFKRIFPFPWFSLLRWSRKPFYVALIFILLLQSHTAISIQLQPTDPRHLSSNHLLSEFLYGFTGEQGQPSRIPSLTVLTGEAQDFDLQLFHFFMSFLASDPSVLVDRLP
jgi:hypothetical protein